MCLSACVSEFGWVGDCGSVGGSLVRVHVFIKCVHTEHTLNCMNILLVLYLVKVLYLVNL